LITGNSIGDADCSGKNKKSYSFCVAGTDNKELIDQRGSADGE